MMMNKFSKFLFSVAGFSCCLSASPKTELSYRGGDISMLLKYKEMNQSFYKTNKKSNALDIMKEAGCNFFRVRLFVNPNKKRGVIQDLDYVLKLAKALKSRKVKFLLDIHYSDTWADPGQQSIPAQWEKLSFNDLVKKVESYTFDVLSRMEEEACLPDMVQVGNEVTHGMLWPYGKIHGEQGGWERFSQLLKAGVRGVRKIDPDVKIMIHMAPTNSAKMTRRFFQSLKDHGVDYDVIGLSYYPWWHGDLNSLKAHLDSSAVLQNKPFIIVECAYIYAEKEFPKNNFKKGEWEFSPRGQQEFIEALRDLVVDYPLGQGIVWWYPESVKVKGLQSWHGGKAALFDQTGKALPALLVLGSE
jgi:arabinogalactan endo-1,4-beta-galactosidase